MDKFIVSGGHTLSGEITAINAHLEDAPEEVNSDAYGAGWLVKIKFSNPAERDGLLDAAAYKALIA